MNGKAIYATSMVFVGCGSNNVFLEYLVKATPGCGHLITAAQFAFIALYGFIFISKFGTVERKIEMKDYIMVVLLFFSANVLTNWSFNFHIPVPLHMIIRSGSLIANMIMSKIILQRSYSLSKYLSVAIVTAGILLCTFFSSKDVKSCNNCDKEPLKELIPNSQDNFFWWLVGLLILLAALLISARVGIYQESLTIKYGKNPEEAMYYTHLLALPAFLIYYQSIWEHIIKFSNSQLISVLNLQIPILCIYLIMYTLTQYLCISSIFTLTTEVSSLTLTLIITIRKFLSLVFSIFYFNNPFTLGHWIGTLLVFIGTLMYTEVIFRLFEKIKPYFFYTSLT